MNPELSPEEMGLSEEDQNMTEINTDKKSFWERISKSKKIILPAIAIATLTSAMESEASENNASKFLKIRNGYQMNFTKSTAEKFAPEYIKHLNNGSVEIPGDVLSEPIGNFVINGKTVTLEKNWGQALEENKASFEHEMDLAAKKIPLASSVKEKIKSLYERMFPKGLSSRSQIQVERIGEDGNLKMISLPVSYANSLEISNFMTEETKSLFSALGKLPDSERINLTKAIEQEELEIVEFAANQECQEQLKD